MTKVKTETAIVTSQATAEPTQPPGMDVFSLAHLSDLHLTTLINIKTSQLLNKRMLGYFSWRRKRRIVHRLDIVEALLEDLRITCPDHIAVTGDLTHLGLPDEFAEAGQWLTLLGPPERVTVIPGNHEAYAGSGWIRSTASWAPYVVSDDVMDHSNAADFFPSLRIRGKVALIGLCSARPSLPFFAVGSLGGKQLARLDALLQETGRQGLLRIIMIHHPPLPGITKWRKRLVDSKLFAEVVKRRGAELVLHGHTHAQTLTELRVPAGNIPIVGAPSASELNPRSGNCARYYIYRMKRSGLDWQVTMLVRGYSESVGRFVHEKEIALYIPHTGPGTANLCLGNPEQQPGGNKSDDC